MTWAHAELLCFNLAPEKPKHIEGSLALDIDWSRVEKDFVFGLGVERDQEGNFHRVYPTYRDLARKYGCSTARVAQRSKKGNWIARKQKAEALTQEEFAQLEDKAGAKAAALQKHDALALIDRYLEKFAAALEEKGAIKASIADLNTAMRLKAFLMGEADTRGEQKVVHTIDELTRRHLEERRKDAQANGAVGGELGPGEGDPMTTDGDVVEVEGVSVFEDEDGLEAAHEHTSEEPSLHAQLGGGVAATAQKRQRGRGGTPSNPED